MGEIIIEDKYFEWDDNKAEINWKKHKVLFSVAARVFFDYDRIEDFDDEHSDSEDRMKVIGKVGNILVVIYTERGEKYRIISARRAKKREEAKYYDQYSYQ